MEYVIYSLLACFVLSLHIFSMKLMSLYNSQFYPLLIFTTITLLLSRYLAYVGMCKTDNPTNVHMILNMSVFFTFVFTMIFLKIEKFNITYYSIGLILVVVGLCFIKLSCNKDII